MRLVIGVLLTVVVGMFVSKIDETAGGAVFLLGLVLSVGAQMMGRRK